METCDTDLTCQHHKNEINCLRQNCSCLKEDRERNIPQLQQINGVKSLVHLFTVSESPDPGNPGTKLSAKRHLPQDLESPPALRTAQNAAVPYGNPSPLIHDICHTKNKKVMF